MPPSQNTPRVAAAKPPTSRKVKVRATRTGYYNEERKREGAVFVYELAEGKQLPTWVAEVAARTPEANLTGQQVIDQQIADARDQRAVSSTDADVL